MCQIIPVINSVWLSALNLHIHAHTQYTGASKSTNISQDLGCMIASSCDPLGNLNLEIKKNNIECGGLFCLWYSVYQLQLSTGSKQHLGGKGIHVRKNLDHISSSLIVR